MVPEPEHALATSAEPEPEPELPFPGPPGYDGDDRCPDPSSWVYAGNEDIFGFLHRVDSGIYQPEHAAHAPPSRLAIAQPHGSGGMLLRLREALGHKLQSDATWEWCDDDWTEVDDFVQHYLILRQLRRPPFWDTRPLPAAVKTGVDNATCNLPVLIISLKYRDDRRKFVDEHMAGSSIQYECVIPRPGVSRKLVGTY